MNRQPPNAPDAETKSFQSPAVLALSICHFIHDVYTSFLAPMLPMLIESIGMSLTGAGFLGTVMQLPAFFNPVIGRYADRYGYKKRIIAVSLVLTSVSMSFLGYASTYMAAVGLVLIAGVGTSLFHVPAPVLIARHSGTRTGKGMSWFMTGGEMARFLGPLTAVSLVGYLGLTGYYPVLIPGILAAVWLFFLTGGREQAQTRRVQASLKQAWHENRHLLKPLSGILVTRGFMHAAMAMFLPVYITRTGGTLMDGGIALAVVEGAGVAGIFVAGPFSDRWGRKQTLAVSLVLAPFAMMGFILTDGMLRFPFMLVTGFFLLSTTPVMLAMIQHHAKHYPSVANGLYMMLSFIARSAVLVIVGLLSDTLGLEVTYQACAAAGVLSLYFLAKLPNTRDEER